jgi:hypothetical protein
MGGDSTNIGTSISAALPNISGVFKTDAAGLEHTGPFERIETVEDTGRWWLC